MSLVKRFTTKNVGNFDRILRSLPFIAFIYVWQTGNLSGTPLLVLGIFAAMSLFTALTARCSIYAMFGLSTCALSNKQGLLPFSRRSLDR